MTESSTGLRANIIEQIPFLRRYARGLTGSGRTGDALVEACLEALVEDPGLVGRRRTRRDLFTLLHRTRYRTATLGVGRPVGLTEQNASHTLRAISEPARQALLLTLLEGFSPDDVAVIMGLERELVDTLLAIAHGRLEEIEQADILLVENKSDMARDLADLLGMLGHRIIATARNRKEAERIARDTPPQLVLADAALLSGSSARKPLFENAGPPVVLIGEPPLEPPAAQQIAGTILPSAAPEDVRRTIGRALFLYSPQPDYAPA